MNNHRIDAVKHHFKYWWKKELTVLATCGAIIGFVNAFGIISSEYGIWHLMATIFLSIIISFIWRAIEVKINNKRLKITETNIEDREATRRSLFLKHIDQSHRITSLLRQDMLDYADGSIGGRDFVSFRVIEGINESLASTDGFTYVECTEYKCRCKDIKIYAIDLKTNHELRVAFIDRNEHDKYYEFPFKIYYATPLKSGEEFAIAFSIVLTNELDVLKDDGEIMSVSLTRYEKGVDKLYFNVCLNFEPSSAQVEFRDGNDFYLEESPVLIEKYNEVSKIERKFRIKWSSQPYIIRWKCIKPKHKLYVIKYRK